jgi:2-succinyl-5-enolpyruvyl-6-hydroxy-3-cyclohexene-1-carboxylate synthase
MHTAIDERCAAFFALGQAKATGRPSLLIATSGTAAAHYLPAVIEASESRTPLLALTADRPPELHRAGAPQTTDQSRLFGLHARASIELGLPSEDPTALRAVRRAAIQAAFRSLHPDPGPVQVNGWLRKPLEPVESSSPADVALRELAARIRREAPSQAARPMLTPDATALAGLAEATSRTRRGVIVCGPAQVAQGSARAAIERLAEITHFPILSETTSQVRFIQRAAGSMPPTGRPHFVNNTGRTW